MKVGIIGLGLIGSSLALKIGEAYNDITIYGEDISESINLADKEPEITKELTKLAEDWRNQIEEKWISEYGAPSEEQRLNTQMGIN